MSDRVDTVVRGTLVNVHTGTLEDGAVAIDDGVIVALDERPAEREIEAEYIAPGLIDAHMHVESSMVTLPRYGAAVVPRGVTSVIHDPHEIANVCGAAGVRAVIEDAEHTPLKARFTVPSSVPASGLQDAGATLDPDAVAELLDAPDVVALGEVMNVPGVVAGDSTVHAKIDAARERGLPVDGHMPRVRGADLHEAARYLDSDHESITLDEARAKADVGLRVYLREGSSSKNLADLLGLVEAVGSRWLSLCTDDRDVTDLTEHGGVDFAVAKAIGEGVDPVTAVQLATINTAESYDLPFGRLRPGSPADLVLLSDLDSWTVEHVLIDGVLDPTTDREKPPSSTVPTDTVSFDPVDGADLAIEATGGDGPVAVRAIDAIGGLQTARLETEVPRSEGVLRPDTDEDVLSLAVIERHGAGGGVGRGFVHGLGLDRGAVGSTVAHDAHNVVVAGTSHEAMARIANHLREIGGGVAAYDPESGAADAEEDGMTALSLPVAGLMSDEPLETVAEEFGAVEDAAREIGLDHDGGIMELSFLSLEVIPELRLTNNGLVDVVSMEYVDAVVE
ncbi:adenine deaminase [Halococcus saccharolyticus]|uniref:Adenine deaminase n=1 Tax=Halococcus saccharolyticus DSM 5350 TaxID=1227455 RepID=M0MCX9_9EURY|nr:adenine deaminase [Halococcus saccharolyticus]EMA43208.1 adenine deaminase [Halococcus saccharolyticus DSM 5350]